MPFLLFLLGALGAIALWYWRYRAARDAVGEVGEIASEVRSAFRRYGYKRKVGQHPADAVEDPRVAAVAILAATARLDGALTRAQIDAITREAAAAFRIDLGEAEQMGAYGRWIADQAADPDDVVRRLTPLIRDKAERPAHLDLVARMHAVAEVENGVSDMQEQLIARLEDRLGLSGRQR